MPVEVLQKLQKLQKPLVGRVPEPALPSRRPSLDDLQKLQKPLLGGVARVPRPALSHRLQISSIKSASAIAGAAGLTGAALRGALTLMLSTSLP